MGFDIRNRVNPKMPTIDEPEMIHISDIKIEPHPNQFGGLEPIKPFYKFYRRIPNFFTSSIVSHTLDGWTFIGWVPEKDAPGRIAELVKATEDY